MDEIQLAPVEVQAKHYAGLLRQAVRAAGFSVSEIERRLGTGPKALRRVFGGSVDLKFKHVIAVLRIIGARRDLERLVRELPPRQRRLLRLSFGLGLNVHELAHLLGGPSRSRCGRRGGAQSHACAS